MSFYPCADYKTRTQEYGGKVTHNVESAQILLFSETFIKISPKILKLQYDAHDNPALRNIYVEPLSFLTKCINSRYFKLGSTNRIKKGMPGRLGGSQP